MFQSLCSDDPKLCLSKKIILELTTYSDENFVKQYNFKDFATESNLDKISALSLPKKEEVGDNIKWTIKNIPR